MYSLSINPFLVAVQKYSFIFFNYKNVDTFFRSPSFIFFIYFFITGTGVSHGQVGSQFTITLDD